MSVYDDGQMWEAANCGVAAGSLQVFAAYVLCFESAAWLSWMQLERCAQSRNMRIFTNRDYNAVWTTQERAQWRHTARVDRECNGHLHTGCKHDDARAALATLAPSRNSRAQTSHEDSQLKFHNSVPRRNAIHSLQTHLDLDHLTRDARPNQSQNKTVKGDYILRLPLYPTISTLKAHKAPFRARN